jgi:predicted aspartyl protease
MNLFKTLFPAFLVTVLLSVVTTEQVDAQQMMDPADLPEMGEFYFEGEQVVLPLLGKFGHPRVTVDLGDGEEYTFIVDTGASVNVLDTGVAKRLGFAVTGQMEIGAPGGAQVPGDIVMVPLAHVGSAEIRDAEFVTFDVATFSMGMTHGVLGLKLFREFVLTYDQSNGEIRVSRGELSPDVPGVLSWANNNGHINVELDVAGTSVTAHIDTGSMGEFMLPAEIMGEIPLKAEPKEGPKARMVGGQRETTMAQLDGTASFAGHSFQDPGLVFMSPSTGYGNIGMGVMGEMAVSIDQQNHLISFIRENTEPRVVSGSGSGNPKMVRKGGPVVANQQGGKRSVGVMFQGFGGMGELKIANVVPGSLAESAGLMPGDKLIAINDQKIGDYEMADLGELFGSSKPLHIEVDREGALKTFKIE